MPTRIRLATLDSDGKVPVGQLPDVGGKFIVVSVLPSVATADPKAIYLVPRTTSETNNIYDEYLRVEPTTGTYAWEKIGSTTIDLSGYVQKTQTVNGIPLSGNITLKASDVGAATAADLVPKANRSELCSAWAANTNYTTTSVVIHDNALYHCTTAHTSSSTWDSSKWESTTLAQVMAQYLSLAGGTIVDMQLLTGQRDDIDAEGYDGFGPHIRLRRVEAGGDMLIAIGSESSGGADIVNFGIGTEVFFARRPYLEVGGTNFPFAITADIPYSLTTKSVTSGAVTLDNHASNIVLITSTLSPNTLTINFPTATLGEVRDFALLFNLEDGVTAPEITWPLGVALKNEDGNVPEIADGESSTILYFSEVSPGTFLVKGETLTRIALA